VREPLVVVRDGSESGIMGYWGLRHSSPPKRGGAGARMKAHDSKVVAKQDNGAVTGAIWICRPTREARRDSVGLRQEGGELGGW
jgi:hypothetical protein